MITVNDPYNLVPELFINFPEFSKTSGTHAQVDILPAVNCEQSFEYSTRPTVFVQPEPTIDYAHVEYHQQLAARPCSAWAVSGYRTVNNWQLKKWFVHLANLTMTVRVNPVQLELAPGHKPWLATALLGGWTFNRGQLLNQLGRLGILDQCLVNYQERAQEPINRRNTKRQQYPEIFFNTRSPELDHLDDPLFLKLAFTPEIHNENQLIAMNTCCSLPGIVQGQHGWISQLIPWKIYNSAYISIVAETEGPTELFFISEKISRPMLVGHPFVVFGCAGYLAELQKLGFRTFSPWIDESYDHIQDATQRTQAIAHSVKQFSQLSDQQKQHACQEMTSVTQHNRGLLLDSKWTHQSLRDAILDLEPAEKFVHAVNH